MIRGYSEAYFADGTPIAYTLQCDEQQATVMLDSAQLIPVAPIQANTLIYAFSEHGRYEIRYRCPFRFVQTADRHTFTLQLLSCIFYRNQDNGQ